MGNNDLLGAERRWKKRRMFGQKRSSGHRVFWFLLILAVVSVGIFVQMPGADTTSVTAALVSLVN